MSSLLRLAIALSVVAGTLVPDARGAVLCRKRSGRVVIADACGRKETALAPGDVGLVGPTGTPGGTGAPGDRGVVPYAFIDPTGHQVGIIQTFVADFAQVVLT